MTTATALGAETLLTAHKRFALAGVNLSCIDRAAAIDALFALVAARAGGYITITDAHGIVAAQADARLREIIGSARLALPDGMPSVWLGRLKGYPMSRVAGSDFIREVLGDPRARAVRHYFYGGDPQQAKYIVEQAEQRLGRGAIAGWYAPPFREAGALEDQAAIDRIAAAAPDVIWVGLGGPKQDYWMANHCRFFPHAVMIGIGAALGVYAGLQTRAPRWMQSAGLEWLFRLAQEPQRLWPRYRRVVPGMLRIMIAEAIHR
jgi:N-acetylglucosaminyldiphosphoundecaprenol N-acetyl-beta-D-mannosaminyltransferase